MSCPRKSLQEWSSDLAGWASAVARIWFYMLAAVAAVTIAFVVCRLAWWAAVVVHKALGG
jgi:hypothetical protein